MYFVMFCAACPRGRLLPPYSLNPLLGTQLCSAYNLCYSTLLHNPLSHKSHRPASSYPQPCSAYNLCYSTLLHDHMTRPACRLMPSRGHREPWGAPGRGRRVGGKVWALRAVAAWEVARCHNGGAVTAACWADAHNASPAPGNPSLRLPPHNRPCICEAGSATRRAAGCADCTGDRPSVSAALRCTVLRCAGLCFAALLIFCRCGCAQCCHHVVHA